MSDNKWPAIGLTLPHAVADRVAELAAASGEGKSGFIRRIIIKELDRIEANRPAR